MTDPSPPLVSIITPAYNRADLVAETIESVLGQDYSRLEYIVLDDGSSDATLEVIRRYDGRLRWESHSNMGETATVNRGFALAQGEVIGVVNSDDPLLPGAVRRLVEALLANPRAVVAYPDWQGIDPRGEPVETIEAPDFTGAIDMIRRHFCLPGPGALFRRSLLQASGGRDPRFRYVADLAFWFGAALVGDFVRVPEVLATFRVHPGSASVNQQGERMADEHVRLVETFFERADLPSEMLEIQDEALSSAHYVAGTSLGGRVTRKKLWHFVQALRIAPTRYAGEYRRRTLMMMLSCGGVSAMQATIAKSRLSVGWRRLVGDVSGC